MGRRAKSTARRGWRLWVLATPLALGGCARHGFRLFDPAGPVARASLDFTIADVAVMMCIIAPTGLAIAWFLWRYRRGRNAAYDPRFVRSHLLEFIMWGVPLLVVVLLAFISFRGVYAVDPYGPRILSLPAKPGAGPSSKEGPLKIDVIATDWQWVFIYPKQHIATVDRLVVPEGRTVTFRLTATDVVNDFFIPSLADMIDVMPGMRTRDAMRATRLGVFEGFSADFSGPGFSWMRFPTRVVPPRRFAAWVARRQAAPEALDYARFERLARPTINLHQRPFYFHPVEAGLFDRVIGAAVAGKTYPVPAHLTEHMATDFRHHAAYLDAAKSDQPR